MNLMNKFDSNGAATALEAYAYDTSITSAVIPDGATAVASSGFNGCTSLTEVTVCDGVLSIGSEAFRNCTSLTSVTMPDSLTALGDRIFSYCSLLEYVVFGDGITSVSSSAFSSWPGWPICALDSDTAKTISHSEFWFRLADYPSILLQYWGTPEQLYVKAINKEIVTADIPLGVDRIEYDGFKDCDLLTEIVIPEGVTAIGSGAFRYCDLLARVTLPETLETLDSYCFANCPSIGDIYFPDGVKQLGSNVFYNDDEIKYASLGSEAAMAISRVDYCFHIVGYTNVKLQYQFSGDEITSLDVMKENSDIASAEIPSGVTRIPSNCFSGCANLTLISIPDTVTEIANNAMPKRAETLITGCASYARAWAEQNRYPAAADAEEGSFCYQVIHTGEETEDDPVMPTETEPGLAFGTHCAACGEARKEGKAIPALQDLDVLRLPRHLKTIEPEAFYGLNCEAVILPDGCETIGAKAFSDCKKLIYVFIPASVVHIADNAFDGCGDLLIDRQQ